MCTCCPRLFGAVGLGHIAVAEGHVVVVIRVDHLVVRPSQPAPGPGLGQMDASQGQAVVVKKVEHHVLCPRQLGPGP